MTRSATGRSAPGGLAIAVSSRKSGSRSGTATTAILGGRVLPAGRNVSRRVPPAVRDRDRPARRQPAAPPSRPILVRSPTLRAGRLAPPAARLRRYPGPLYAVV